MKGIVITKIFCLLYLDLIKAETVTEYLQRRAQLIDVDYRPITGNQITLTDREQLINERLLHWKHNDTQNIDFSGSFFSYRDKMRRSKVYEVIRRMPKGAALHVHGSLMLHPDDLIQLTYEEHLYICLTRTYLQFRFSENTPSRPCPDQWVLLHYLRTNETDPTHFDAMLKERLTLGPEDSMGLHYTEDEMWNQFRSTMSAILSLIEYRPVREKMIYQSLYNFYNDNIMYVEIRIALYPLYELNGTVHDQFYMATLHDQIAKKFMHVHPNFSGLKLILSPSRKLSAEQMRYEMSVARTVKGIMPDVIAGFDIVGHETQKRPLTEFLPILLEAKEELNFFFHAGETNEYGTPTDENLFDAVLLETKRIGHAVALVKHPALIKAVYQKDIAIEVSLISNNVLSLVKDLRSHPLATYMALGLPLVLSSDNPGVWGARPLSDDFYVALVAVANRRAGLATLKRLAINSITYSSLEDMEKVKLIHTFDRQWYDFINNVFDDTELSIDLQ